MEYVLILREGDIDIINDHVRKLDHHSSEELVDLYNKQVRCGITGVHAQALYLCALGHLFYKRFDESPIYLKDRILGMSGKAKLVDGELHYQVKD